MELSHSLSTLAHRRTHRVRGPRPFSWMSSSLDPSKEYRDAWPWGVRSSNLFRESTLYSSASSQSSDSSVSSPSLHPVDIPDARVERGEPYHRHGRRRRPAGPRAPRGGSHFDVRQLELWIGTSQSAIPPPRRDVPPITPTFAPAESSQIPPYDLHPSTNFPLDWDAIFEILGCEPGGWWVDA